MPATIHTCRQLLVYTLWADRTLLKAVAKMTDEDRLRETGTSFGSVQGTMAHLLGAQWVWLSRFLGNPLDHVPGIESYRDLDALREGFEDFGASLEMYLASLTEEQLDAEFTWTTTQGASHRYPLWGALIHMINHSTYHRGQVVSMQRQLGYEPPSTDFIYYLLDRASPTR